MAVVAYFVQWVAENMIASRAWEAVPEEILALDATSTFTEKYTFLENKYLN